MTNERRELLQSALVGWRKTQADINAKIAEVEAELRGNQARSINKPKYKMSAAGRARIAGAARARWAEYRKARESAA